MDTAARITHRETEEKITLSFFFLPWNDLEAVKAHSEETARTCSLGVVCFFVGEIWAVSNEFLITEKGDSLSLLYTLSIPFFIRLCKHKKC